MPLSLEMRGFRPVIFQKPPGKKRIISNKKPTNVKGMIIF